MLKIGIIIPWDSPFIWTAPAFNMMNWERPEGCEVKFIMGAGWCPAARHNDGVAKAQDWGADLIAFNGGDHLCPKDILIRMKARIDEGWDMVHVMVPSRGIVGHSGQPFQSISYKVVGPVTSNFITNCPRDSIKIITWDDEPQQTHICGTGNIMMKAEILGGLQKPYFEEHIKKDNLYGREAVQDSQFVSRCTIDSGAKMFCDTSIKLVHLDVFGIDDTFNDRFKDKVGRMDWSPSKDIRKFI
jgi:hypothetical protein